MTIMDKACYERGCACYDSRDGDEGVEVVAKRERVVFPTMLRQMWSGGEVQAWLDEHVNKDCK